jgi:hypothetical protein
LIREGGYHPVARAGAFEGGAFYFAPKGGDDEQSTGIKSRPPLRPNSARPDVARQAYDDGLLPGEQHDQSFLFRRRLKTADNNLPFRAPPFGKVLGGEEDAGGGIAGREYGKGW